MSDQLNSSAVPSVPTPNFDKNSSAGSDLKTTPINGGIGSSLPFSPNAGLFNSSSSLSPISAKTDVDTKP